MKKLLSLVLVLAVVLSSMSFAFAAAPTDIAGTDYESAVNKLVGLGVINGYPDGTFKPTNNITRAEFAKVVITALGYSDAAVAAAGDSKFNDVTSHWAKGYVNVASTLGIINGVGNGKFDPDSNVTFEQAVTMIVRALGYEPAAKANGGYPVGYLTIASQKEITKDVKGVPGTAANRGIVAQLVDKSLEVNFLEQTGYGTLTEYKENATKNLMKTGLKLDLWEGKQVKSVDTTAKKIEFVNDVDGKRKYDYVDTLKVTGLDNCKVNFYAKDGKIYSLDNKTTVKFDKLTETDAVAKTIKLKVADTKYYYLDTVAVELDKGSSSVAAVAANKLAKLYIDSDNKVYRIEAFNLGNEGIVKDASASIISYQKPDTNDSKIRNLDTADSVVVFIDGVQKTVADIKADMYITSWNVNKDFFIVCTTAQKAGKLDAWKSDKIKIAGAEYDFASNTGNYFSFNKGVDYNKSYANIADLYSKDITAYLNAIGEVRFVKGETGTTETDFYAIAKKAWVAGSDYLRVVKNVDGASTEVDYVLDLDNSPISFKTVSDGITAGADNAVNDEDGGLLYKFTVNSDNKIKKIARVTLTGTGTLKELNKDNDYIVYDPDSNPVTLNDVKVYVTDTAFFKTYKESDSSYEPKAIYWANLEGKAVAGLTVAYVADTNASLAKAVVVTRGYDAIGGGDKFYAHVAEQYAIKDNNLFSLDTPTGNVSVQAGNDYISTSKKDAFIEYTKETDGKIKVSAVVYAVYDNDNLDGYVATNASVSYDAAIDKVDASGKWLFFGQTVTGTKVASDALVYRVVMKNDGTIDNVTVSDLSTIQVGDSVLAMKNSDGVIKAVFYRVH